MIKLFFRNKIIEIGNWGHFVLFEILSGLKWLGSFIALALGFLLVTYIIGLPLIYFWPNIVNITQVSGFYAPSPVGILVILFIFISTAIISIIYEQIIKFIKWIKYNILIAKKGIKVNSVWKRSKR